jgi:outer membrane protease
VQYGPNVNVYPYVPWREDFEKIPVYGTGIAYTQAWNILSVGIGVSKRILPHLELQAGTSLSPVVYCEDQDDHFLRLVQFNETMTGGRGIEPFASASYSFGDSAVLRLEYSYRYLDRVRGTTKITKIGSGQTLGTMTDGAGAAYGVHDVGLTLMVRL